MKPIHLFSLIHPSCWELLGKNHTNCACYCYCKFMVSIFPFQLPRANNPRLSMLNLPMLQPWLYFLFRRKNQKSTLIPINVFTSIPLLTFFSPNMGKQSFKIQVLRKGNMSEAPGLGPYQGWTDLLSHSPWEIFLTASEFDHSFPQLLNQDTWVFSDYLLNICQIHSLLSAPTETTLCQAPSLCSFSGL